MAQTELQEAASGTIEWTRTARNDFRAMVDIVFYGMGALIAVIALYLVTFAAPTWLLADPAGPALDESGQPNALGTVIGAIVAALMLYFWGIAPAVRLVKFEGFGKALSANMGKLWRSVMPFSILLGCALTVFASLALAVERAAGPALWISQVSNVVFVVIILTIGWQLHVLAHRSAHQAFALSYLKPTPAQRLIGWLRKTKAE